MAALGGQLGKLSRKNTYGRPKGKEFEQGKGSKDKKLGILPYGQNQSSSWMDKERNQCVSPLRAL